MKTKFYWVALLASAAMIAQAKAGGHHGGGGGGGFAMAARPAPAHAAAPAVQSAPRSNFGGGRHMAPVTRLSSYQAATAFRQQRLVGSDRTFSRQFATGTATRRFDGSRIVNGRETRLTRNGNDSRNRFQNRGLNVGREHVFARRSADWHRDWDRRRDHWWHGHRCHFVNGFWFIYDTGFYPYDIGIRTAMATATTGPLTIRTTTIPVFMRTTAPITTARAPTAHRSNIPIPRLRPSRSS
jgi:hypothetical protein